MHLEGHWQALVDYPAEESLEARVLASGKVSQQSLTRSTKQWELLWEAEMFRPIAISKIRDL